VPRKWEGMRAGSVGASAWLSRAAETKSARDVWLLYLGEAGVQKTLQAGEGESGR
jgi:hypothetical protein